MDQPYKIPFTFILDYLHPKKVTITHMFGCFGVYVNGKMVFLLRDRKDKAELNGVWVAATPEGSASLSKDLPSVNRDLKLVPDKKSGGTWLLIAARDDHFESVVIKACELVKKGDTRIGKLTKRSSSI